MPESIFCQKRDVLRMRQHRETHGAGWIQGADVCTTSASPS